MNHPAEAKTGSRSHSHSYPIAGEAVSMLSLTIPGEPSLCTHQGVCTHQGGLRVQLEDVCCAACGVVLGTVWDEVGAAAWDGFEEAYYGDLTLT